MAKFLLAEENKANQRLPCFVRKNMKDAIITLNISNDPSKKNGTKGAVNGALKVAETFFCVVLTG